MNEMMLELLLPLTAILSLLLVFHKPVLKHLGANAAYYLWGLVPLCLLIYTLPIHWFAEPDSFDNTISTFMVTSSQTIQNSVRNIEFSYVWGSLSLLLFSYGALSYMRFYRKLTILKLENKDHKACIPEHLSVYSSQQTFSPMLVGLFKQKLVLPENFTELYNQEQQQLILEHEICHFDRNDIYWNLIAFTLVALFWFHPLVWLAYFRFRRDQELSCDQTVLARKHLNSRINYSKALLVTAENAPPLAFAQLSFKKYGDKNIMFERINHIKRNTKTSKLSLAALTLGTITILSSMSYAGNIGNAGDYANKGEKANGTKFDMEPIVRIEPEYPYLAIQQKLSGAVLLKFDVKKNGHTENITVVKSQPEGVFDNVALTALSHWKYKVKNNQGVKNNMVQLDFAFDKDAEKIHLVEGIKISK